MQNKIFSALAAGMLLLMLPGTAFATDAGPQSLYQCTVDTNVPTWQTDHVEGSVYIGHCDAQDNPYYGITVTDREFYVVLYKCNIDANACNPSAVPGNNWVPVAQSGPYSVGLGASDVNQTFYVESSTCSGTGNRKYAVQVSGELPTATGEFAGAAPNVSTDNMAHNCPSQ